MAWGATKAKAQFSGLLTAAESEGPQVIRRRGQVYVLTTQEEIDKRIQEARHGKRKSFLNALEALRPPLDQRYDVKVRRLKNGMRYVDFGE